MLVGTDPSPPGSRAGRRTRHILFSAALLCGASAASFVVLAQTPADTLTIDTAVLGMTGWRTDPMVVETAVLRMTGWRTAPMTVDTAVLGMTGWRTDPMTIDTAVLGMTGWRTAPVTIETAVLGMTGWRTDPVTVETAVLGMTGWRTDGPKVLSGTLDLRDPNGPACPRQAQAALSLKTNVAGPVPYSLDCTGDRSWSQTATAHKTAPGTYLAVAVIPFSVEHKEQVNCVLKSQSPPKVLALRGHAFDCAKTAPDSVVAPPIGVPPRVVVDPPRPTCVGGRLLATGIKGARYTCHCPAGLTVVSTGPHSYLCQRKTTVGITCAGGTVRNGQCLCPSTMQKTQAGANAWRCQRRGTSAGPKSRPQ